MISGSSVKTVDTSVGMQMIEDGKAQSIKVLESDQRVDITLKVADPKFGKDVQFFYVADRGKSVVDAVAAATLDKGYNDEVPNTPWYISLLASIFPFLIIGAIFWFIMSGAGGGGGSGEGSGVLGAAAIMASNRQAVFPTRMALTTFKQKQIGAQKGACGAAVARPPLPPPVVVWGGGIKK